MIADYLRSKLLENNLSFEFETVMSYEGKIDFLNEAKQKGYKIYLYFLCCESPQINVRNVENRVKNGGHYVDPKKIVERYYKALNNLFGAVQNSDVSYILENTMLNGCRQVCEIKDNQIVNITQAIPTWFDKYYLQKSTTHNS